MWRSGARLTARRSGGPRPEACRGRALCAQSSPYLASAERRGGVAARRRRRARVRRAARPRQRSRPRLWAWRLCSTWAILYSARSAVGKSRQYVDSKGSAGREGKFSAGGIWTVAVSSGEPRTSPEGLQGWRSGSGKEYTVQTQVVAFRASRSTTDMRTEVQLQQMEVAVRRGRRNQTPPLLR
jgi:hypothetical protein